MIVDVDVSGKYRLARNIPEGRSRRDRRAELSRWSHRGAWSLEEPKTLKARRTVLLPKMTVQALREHWRRQAAQRLARGPTYSAQDFIFADPTVGPIDIRALVRPHFDRILQRAGIPRMRLYDLRHGAATLLLSAGVHVNRERDARTFDSHAHIRRVLSCSGGFAGRSRGDHEAIVGRAASILIGDPSSFDRVREPPRYPTN
jgi:integrase